jgi:hypothetical protein
MSLRDQNGFWWALSGQNISRVCADPPASPNAVPRLNHLPSRRSLRFRFVPPSPVAPRKDNIMAKSQKKSNKEIRKPKAAKVKNNASSPSAKAGVVVGLENIKTGRGK